MFIGFDYGTANCSVAVMRDGKPQLLKMENDSTLLPSMLCAPTREAVSEWLYRHHDVPADDDETQALLRRAIRYNREEDIDVTAKSVQFGLSSLAQYIDDPEEVAGYIRNSSHHAAIFAHRQTTGIIILSDRFHTTHRTGGEKSQHPRPVIRRLPVQCIQRIS